MNPTFFLVSVVMALVALGVPILPTSTYAASQDECAIWLCLPGGFPSGCGDAKKALSERLEKGKSPLPSFASCAVDNGSGQTLSYVYGPAAAIKEHQVCKRWHYYGRDDDSRCVAWETIPAHIRKGVRCRRYRNGETMPTGCIATMRYVDIVIDGSPVGDTFYF